jgi:hypothetical protein
MLPSVLALLSAFAYGAADFLGGLATHRSNATAVVIASQAAGLILLAAIVLVLSGSLLMHAAWHGAAAPAVDAGRQRRGPSGLAGGGPECRSGDGRRVPSAKSCGN